MTELLKRRKDLCWIEGRCQYKGGVERGSSYLVHLDLVSGAAGESLVASAGHVALVLGELNRLGSALPVVTALRDNVLATVQLNTQDVATHHALVRVLNTSERVTLLCAQGRAGERGVVLELEDVGALEVLLANGGVVDARERD